MKKFDESTLNSDLYELSNETTTSGFNEMSQSIREAQKLNEQAQTIEENKFGKETSFSELQYAKASVTTILRFGNSILFNELQL